MSGNIDGADVNVSNVVEECIVAAGKNVIDLDEEVTVGVEDSGNGVIVDAGNEVIVAARNGVIVAAGNNVIVAAGDCVDGDGMCEVETEIEDTDDENEENEKNEENVEVPEVADGMSEPEYTVEDEDEEDEEWYENEEQVPEVEPVTRGEEVETVNGGEDHTEEIAAPTKGMEFESALSFVTHIHRYGFANGFQVRIRDSCKSKSAAVDLGKNVGYAARTRVHCLANEEHYSKYVRLTLECSKAGVNPVTKIGRRRSHSCRTQCMFRVYATKSVVDGNWKIGRCAVEHNHDLCVSNSRFLPNYRKISPDDAKIILENDAAGVKIGSNYQVFVVKYGGCAGVPFTERDLRNLLRGNGRRKVEGGDFNAMEKHFCEMKQKNPTFYYEYDIDENGVLRNVFWADGRSRAAAKEFGDTVSFDSTYVTNRYRMPFSPFISVNHHGNSLLPGCALITMEDAKSYEWVFKAWQRCMGRAPVGIITDQCKAIAKAVRTVFPDTKQRWCIWHIKRNLCKNMGSASNWVEINSEFRKLLSHMMTVSEFEDGLKAWGEKHKLESKLWFKDLLKDRKRWAPVYFKNDFWAGMSSTQRSEGMNHFFKGYVTPDTTLKVFLDQYGLAVEKRANAENRLKFSNAYRTWSTTTKHGFEVVFQELFTSSKFLEIQEQIEMLNYANGTMISRNDDEVKYEVVMSKIFHGVSRRRKFVVCLDKATMDMRCECKNFEFRGILCSHAMNVMVLEGIDVVPEKFLYSRWRKDLPREYLKEKLPYKNLKGNETEAMKRYAQMAEACSRVCLSAMQEEFVFKLVMRELGKLSLNVQFKTTSSTIVSSTMGGIGRVYGRKGRDKEPESGDPREEDETVRVKDPLDRRGKGRTPTKRKGADLDKKISGSHRKGASKKKQRGDAPVGTPEERIVMPQVSGVFGYDPLSGVQMTQPTPFWVPPFPFSVSEPKPQ